jgi:manganese oxidase
LTKDFSRRGFLSHLGVAAVGGQLLSGCTKTSDASANMAPHSAGDPQHVSLLNRESPAANFGNSPAVITPGIATLPFTMDGSTKVFELQAEPVTIEFPDATDPHGLAKRPIAAWGYNGSVIGPTIEAVEGDRVRIIVRNRLPEPTTVHWHGIHLPLNMDGIPGFSQDPIAPGETFVYEFDLIQHGTYFYHPHFMAAKQAGLGMVGFFIIHPKNPTPEQIVDRDFAYFLQTWMIDPGSPIPDTMEMSDFNYFSMNGRAAPNIVPMAAVAGEKVRIRVANLSMLTHPIHLHGHTFRITEYGAGFLPPNQQIIANTINISSAEVRTLEFRAGPYPGKWLFHCHFLHHVMNDMHRTPIPGGPAGHAGHDSGGMHTWIEVSN